MGGGGKIPYVFVKSVIPPGTNGFDLAGTPRKSGPPLVDGMPNQLTGGPTLRLWALS